MDFRICTASVALFVLLSLPWVAAHGANPGLSATGLSPVAVDEIALTEADVLPARDGDRAGIVVDRQGTALVRPVARERWSPLGQRSVLLPGDLVRTSARGAHAVEVRLAGGGTLIVGPGTLVEIRSGDTVRLLRGELAVTGSATKPIEVTGPGGFRTKEEGTLVARVTNGKVTRLAAEPKWLTGYRNSTTDEWVGSLLAKVDGRDVPLAVGYHKVDAVIRDQIAQTTVEQSFINGTKNRLEGVFYFPLPADASISGFGMWIGGELVEADIVEKQRARQIFEDIMRRKKDPGLLEWSGGNLFKARVFPIEPMSEKRIRIRYTQVLPLEGATVRYRYGLRSELLRKRPLRSLDISVSISSASSIKAVASTTHEMRVRQTDHAAKLEFDAQEYAPERDFEATITLARRPPLQVIPHRRGEDGYFMMLLAPPGPDSEAWQRRLVPDGKPLDLLVVADTSASMDPENRRVQREFLGALLGMLTERDAFRLMTADLEVRNFTAEPAAVTEKSIESALSFLADRHSLGWTDLPKMLGEVRRQSRPNTVVVYVGDGIGTKGDPDPVALAQGLKRSSEGFEGVVHAVSTGSTYEQRVLEVLASIGGGSVRRSDDDPMQAAFGLLSEAAQPAVKDLAIAFEGVRTARVYPEAPANLPVGQQQVILGRFLPSGKDQAGQVVVTGTLRGEPVRYVAPIQIRAGEEGNSFLPRLWARRHLDALLSQGSTAKVKEDIVAFSEEYGIMTPFTSFLVLENDADRERYGVERRVRMRDGEQFFATGRDAATTEILRQQLRVARTYRLRLKERMLNEIKALGRDLHRWSVAQGEESGLRYRGRGKVSADSARLGGEDFFFMGARASAADGPVTAGPGSPPPRSARPEEQDFDGRFEPSSKPVSRALESAEKRIAPSPALDPSLELASGGGRGFREQARALNGGFLGQGRYVVAPAEPLTYADLGFPHLAAAAEEPVAPRRASWSKEILELVSSLDRRSRMRAAAQGFELKLTTEYLHGVQGRTVSFQVVEGLYGQGRWLRRSHRLGDSPVVDWVDGGQRAVVDLALGLGRQRPAVARDGRFQIQLFDLSMTDFPRSYADYAAALVNLDGGLVRLTLTPPKPRRDVMEFDVDPKRRVVVAYRARGETGIKTQVAFSDFVEVAGMFFARRVEETDDRGQVVRRRRLAVSAVSMDALARGIQKARSEVEGAVLLGVKAPVLADAREAVRLGKATFADRLRVAFYYANTDQWDAAWQRFEPLLAAVGDESARRSLQLVLLSRSRRGEQLRAALPAAVAALAERGEPGVRESLANRFRQLAAGVLSVQERMDLLESLRGVLLRPAADGSPLAKVAARHRAESYHRDHASLLRQLGRIDAAMAAEEANARAYPDDHGFVLRFVRGVQQTQDYRRVAALIETNLAKKNTWTRGEQRQFFGVWFDVLYELRDLPGMERVATAWIEADPETTEAYQRHLAALLYRDKGAVVDAWVEKAFTLDPKDPAQAAQLRAGVREALGTGFRRYRERLLPRWRGPLARLGRRLLATDGSAAGSLAMSILASRAFRGTDEHAALVAELRATVVEGGVATMPLGRLMQAVDFLSWGEKDLAKADWDRVCAALRVRFDKSADADTRDVLGDLLLTVLDARKAETQSLAFLRHWLANVVGRPEHVAKMLFDRLLRATWTQAREDEALALVPRLTDPNATPEQQEAALASTIRSTADQLVKARVKAELGEVAVLETLPRAERRLREKTADTNARQALAGRLAAVAATADAGARRWWRLESLSFAVEAGGDRAAQVAAADALLASIPQSPMRENQLHALLRERCCLVMSFAASRRGVAPAVTTAAIEALQAKLREQEKSLDWRYQLFRLAIATDRTKDLVGWLRAWIQPGTMQTQVNRVALAYLLAEQGDLAAATGAFEAASKLDVLRPEDYANLANWYLVVGDDAARARALDRQLEVSSESELAVVLNRVRARSGRAGGGVVAMSDRDVQAIRMLLRKAQHPQNYGWQIRRAYQGSKDFRILSCLPFGVVGHSVGATYDFLRNSGGMIGNVHEEATCDRMMAAIAEAETLAKTDVDRRGLLLLTAQVERRAAEVKNAPGPHLQAALAAMRTAAKGSFERGERAAMAHYLAGLGKLKDASLAKEQLTQLRALFADEKDAIQGLTIAGHYAQRLSAYGQRDEAADALEVALGAVREATPGHLPNGADGVVRQYVSLLELLNRHGRAESFLLAERARQPQASRQEWYARQLDGLYVHCVRNGGTVSLGTGADLFSVIRARMLRRMWEGSAPTLDYTLNSLLNLHQAGAKAGLGIAKRELLAFANTTLPELLPRFLADQGSRITKVATSVRSVVGAAAGLEVLVRALENEPAWLQRVSRGYWRSFSWSLARSRNKAGDAGLNARLLPIALAALEEDLGAGSWRARNMFFKSNRDFWAQAAGEFAKTAEKFAMARRDSIHDSLFAARYLWSGLGERDAAIGILAELSRRGTLDEAGRWQLAVWHVDAARADNAVPLLRRLVAARPDRLDYRLMLVKAQFQSGARTAALALLEDSAKRCQDKKAWSESVVAQFARTAFDGHAFEQAVTYYTEAVRAHERSGSRRWNWRQVRSGYYGFLARAQAKLGKTVEAIESASAAVVTLGDRARDRAVAMKALHRVIAGAEDLTAIVRQWDAKVAASGLDAPLIRKEFGQVFLEQGEAAQAVAQLRLARDLQPLDDEIHKRLVQAYDRLKDAKGAVAALHRSIEMSPMNLDLYGMLASRYERAGQEVAAARAYTSMVEVKPNEAESHARLAKVMDRQKRFAEAALQWEQVLRVRSEEPDGWLGLAKSQLQAGRWKEADAAIQHVLKTNWDARFKGTRRQAERLQKMLQERRPK